MSITGIWARSPDCARSGLARLLAALPGALPNAARSVFPDSFVALGYCPTVSLLELHSNPVVDAARRLAVVGDVRLDNRSELLASLGVQGASQRDNELVLLAYERWQEDCVDHLLGDFTFVVHDAAQQKVFAARDVAGTRALYYCQFDGTFAFASNPGTLRALPGLPRDLDARAVVDYLGDFPEDEEATLLRVVRRLPPGASLTYGASGLRVRSYFDVKSIRELKLASDDEYAEALRAELARAVACRLPASARSGTMLSGGLDSSMITALAARSSATRVSTFSAVFDETPECDERVYQAPVVRAAGTEHHEVRPRPEGAAADLAQLFRIFGDPIPVGPHWLAWAVAASAAEHGVHVLLTGVDGDRVVSHGTGRTAELAFQHRWLELVREVRAVRDFSRWRALRVLAVHALLPVVPEPWRLFLERHDPRRRLPLTSALRFLRPEAVRAAGVAERLSRATRRALSTRDAHERLLTSSNRARDVDLLDRLGAGLGLELRHPFFDRRVLELCLSFPGEQKRQQGRPRYVLRNAMAGLVPDPVRFRPRDTYFDAAFAAWTSPWVQRLATAGPLDLANLEPYVDVRRFSTAAGDCSEIRAEPAGSVDVARRCVILSRWLDSLGQPNTAPR